MTPEHEQAARRRVVNRLRRARGQLDALITAVEHEAPCREVLTQLSALTHALDRAGFAVVSSAMQQCLTDPEHAQTRDGLTTQELEKLFLSLS